MTRNCRRNIVADCTVATSVRTRNHNVVHQYVLGP